MKKNITVIFADDQVDPSIVEFLNLEFQVTVEKSSRVSQEKLDLIIFSGGEDVDPRIYNQNVGKFTHYNEARDQKEFDTFHNFAKKIPKLGICRGAQFLTVVNKGLLIQHVNGHSQNHGIYIPETGENYQMTSTHHQMMFPFNLSEEQYNLIGHSAFFQSTTYLDGDDNEIKLPLNFVEPEIVFYPNTNSLAIQGHPEYSSCSSTTKQYCLNLIKNYLKL